MAIPVACSKVVLSGSLPSGEVWATGYYRAPVSDTVSAQSAIATITSQGTFTGLVASLRPLILTNTTMSKATLYKYHAGDTAAYDVGSVTLATVGTSTFPNPNQTALVTTLRTALNTGRGRGRMYWPANGVTIGLSGLADAANVNSFVQSLAAFFTAEGALVISEKGGLSSTVTRVTADNRTDVIRARAQRMAGIVTATGNV